MFQIGDLVVYGHIGVCRVDDIGAASMQGAEKEKDYYSLVPYYNAKSRIVIPCDNTKIALRPIMTREEASLLMDEIYDIAVLDICSEKVRENMYKEALKSCDNRGIVSLIKTIYERKIDRQAEGKRITSSDEKFYLMAEDKLYGELAIIFGIEKKSMRLFINKWVTNYLADNSRKPSEKYSVE